MENNMTREQRYALLDRIEVLNKVKALLLLPGLAMVTIGQAAEYFEVTVDAIQSCYRRHREELTENGAITLSPSLLQERLIGQNVQLVGSTTTQLVCINNDNYRPSAEAASMSPPYYLAMTMVRDVLKNTGITATAGIGTNLYLAKVAMDIVAKKAPADADGVRIAELDEMSYRMLLWCLTPLTKFWQVGPGTAARLAKYGIHTMGDIAQMLITDEEWRRLYPEASAYDRNRRPHTVHAQRGADRLCRR